MIRRIELEDILIDLDLTRTMRELTRLETHIMDTVPDEILYTEGGHLNLRNRYGAILAHCANLRTILKSFSEG